MYNTIQPFKFRKIFVVICKIDYNPYRPIARSIRIGEANDFIFTKTTDMMTSKRWTALVVLAVSLFVVTMDMTILIMALPELVRG